MAPGDTFRLNNTSSVIIPGESNFMNYYNGDNASQTIRVSLLQLAPTTGLVVTGSGASCNTLDISQMVSFWKYSIDGVQHTKHKDSNFNVNRLKLVTTFGKMPTETVMTSGQVACLCWVLRPSQQGGHVELAS